MCDFYLFSHKSAFCPLIIQKSLVGTHTAEKKWNFLKEIKCDYNDGVEGAKDISSILSIDEVVKALLEVTEECFSISLFGRSLMVLLQVGPSQRCQPVTFEFFSLVREIL